MGITAVLGGEFNNPPISEALAFHALHDDSGAFASGQFAVVVTKGKLFAIAASVGFAHVAIGADDAALEYRKEVFSGIAVLVTD